MINGCISYSVMTESRLIQTRSAKFTLGGKATVCGDQNAWVCTVKKISTALPKMEF